MIAISFVYILLSFLFFFFFLIQAQLLSINTLALCCYRSLTHFTLINTNIRDKHCCFPFTVVIFLFFVVVFYFISFSKNNHFFSVSFFYIYKSYYYLFIFFFVIIVSGKNGKTRTFSFYLQSLRTQSEMQVY